MPSPVEWSAVFRRASRPQFVAASVVMGLSHLWQSPCGRLFAVGRAGLRATSVSELCEALPPELRRVEGLCDAVRQLLRESAPEPPPVDHAAIGVWRKLAASGDLADRVWALDRDTMLSASEFGEVVSGAAPDRCRDRMIASGVQSVGLRLVAHADGPPSVWLPPRREARRRLAGNQWTDADVDSYDISET